MRRLKQAAVLVALAAATLGAPATADAAGLMAAFERYETGQGFQIVLVNVSTGAEIPLPAGVNTTDDEVHPALSPDGRYVAFMRTRLIPKLNGDIVPPPERSLLTVDRETGAVSELPSAGDRPAGPVFTRATGDAINSDDQLRLNWGVRPGQANQANTLSRAIGLTEFPSGASEFRSVPTPDPRGDGEVVETTQGVVGAEPLIASIFGHYVNFVYVNQSTGAVRRSVVLMSTGAVDSERNIGEAAHAVPRSNDSYVALDADGSGGRDIWTIDFPRESNLSSAPAAINTDAPERMPAWSPDNIKLGFVREADSRRNLMVFDATPGIQGIVLTPVDLGPEAPTPQTREYQSAWGGISLANGPASVPNIGCFKTCVRPGARIRLKPRLSVRSSVGIFVVRVTGKRKLLGRTVPRVRVVGRVPLGAARKGANSFRWSGRVNGRRLKRGTYLLTFRALKGNRVLNTSRSVRFKVNRRGKLSGIRLQR